MDFQGQISKYYVGTYLKYFQKDPKLFIKDLKVFYYYATMLFHV